MQLWYVIKLDFWQLFLTQSFITYSSEMQQFNTLKLWNKLPKNLSLPKIEDWNSEANEKMLNLAFFHFFRISSVSLFSANLSPQQHHPLSNWVSTNKLIVNVF